MSIAARQHMNARMSIIKKPEERWETKHLIHALKDMRSGLENLDDENKKHEIANMIKELDDFIKKLEKAEKAGFKLFENVALDESKLIQDFNSFFGKTEALLAKIESEIKSDAEKKEVKQFVHEFEKKATEAMNKSYAMLKDVYKKLLAGLNDLGKKGNHENLVTALVELKKTEKATYGQYFLMRWEEKSADKAIRHSKKLESHITVDLKQSLSDIHKHGSLPKKVFKKELKELKKETDKLMESLLNGHHETYLLMKRMAYYDMMMIMYAHKAGVKVKDIAGHRFMPADPAKQFLAALDAEMAKDHAAMKEKIKDAEILMRKTTKKK